MSSSAAADPALSPRFLAGPRDQLRLTWRSAAIIVLYGTSLLLVNLGGNRVLTFHEVVFCQPAREMLATGDFVVPRIGGVPFLDKGPMTAWLIAGVMAVLGPSEWAVRLPGVASANLTALLIAALTARWFGNRAGLIAGLMQFTTYYMLQLARLAECDTHLVASVCAAMVSFAWANVDSPLGRSRARWTSWTFYLATGVAFLIKGPLGPVFIFSGCLLYLLVSQDLRSMRFFFNPVGLAIFALLVIPYPLLLYVAHPPSADSWLLHNVGRFRGELGQRNPWYYTYQVPLILLPWFPLVVLKLIHAVRHGLFNEPLWRLLACWVVPGLALLCVSSFKSKHYPAPLMPALTIAAAVGMLDYFQTRYRRQKLYHGWLTVGVVLAVAAGMAAVWQVRPAATLAISALIGVFGVAMLIMIELERRRLLNAHLAALLATAWIISAGVFTLVMRHHDTYRDQAELARRINASVPAGETLTMLQLPESQITYYLDTPLVRLDTPDQFMPHLPRSEPARRYVLAPEHAAGLLTRIGEVQVFDRCASIIRWMQPQERLTLFVVDTSPDKIANLDNPPRR
jgi:4-amino-4-deoxy-L-arabinose transferase-like glycosyltransferase